MDFLFDRSALMLNQVDLKFQRFLHDEMDWSWRLNGIRGARGTGKTTMLLQKMKAEHGLSEEAIYLSLDEMYFAEHPLQEVIEKLQARGVQYFYIDEVHKYPNWARILKNVYDYFPHLRITFTGSSIIELNQLNVDLSRRAIIYDLPGLSFREFLAIQGIAQFAPYTLEEILEKHREIAGAVLQKVKPLKYFNEYLDHGYYPYFLESPSLYPVRLEEVLRLVIETDLGIIQNIDLRQSRKIFQLLQILAASVPFKPNISKLSERIGIERNTLLKYLHYLEKAQIVQSIIHPAKGISLLQKPDKLYLENTNIAYALSNAEPDRGNLRETFFLNQIKQKHEIHYPEKGDFLVDRQYIFEVGGRNKKANQIKALPDSYLAATDVEIGVGNQIPLWLFGFLY
jgi:predicted AAA+ superfamily ATPase